MTSVPKRKTFSSKVNIEWLQMAIDRHIAALNINKRKRLHQNQLLQLHWHLKDMKRTKKFKLYCKKTKEKTGSKWFIRASFSVQKSKDVSVIWQSENKIKKEKTDIHHSLSVVYLYIICRILQKCYLFERKKYQHCKPNFYWRIKMKKVSWRWIWVCNVKWHSACGCVPKEDIMKQNKKIFKNN